MPKLQARWDGIKQVQAAKPDLVNKQGDQYAQATKMSHAAAKQISAGDVNSAGHISGITDQINAAANHLDPGGKGPLHAAAQDGERGTHRG